MTLRTLNGIGPRVHPTAYVDETAVVMGDVEIGPECRIEPRVVIRGDYGVTRIGARTSIKDTVVIHAGDLDIGEEVTIGHAAVIEARSIGKGVVIGVNAVLLDGCEVGDFCIVEAGAVVREGAAVPPYSYVSGILAVVRPLREEERKLLRVSGRMYLG